jgi:hypothetical protein
MKACEGIGTLTNQKIAFARSFCFVHRVQGVHGVPDFNGLRMLLLWFGAQKGHETAEVPLCGPVPWRSSYKREHPT